MLVTEINGFDEQCTGCFACANACPKNAIRMELNIEGFFYPVIDEEICVACGKCYNVCYIEKNINSGKLDSKTKILILQADDSIRLKSSSGGVFYQFAEYVLEQGGNVYGATYDMETKSVRHNCTDSVSLQKIMRSKYVQSDIEITYRKVECDLKEGRYVLFCGTPCQVRGLNNYLSHNYERLLVIDFVCHGVPSTGFFKDMISFYEHAENSKITDVTFREKDKGWRTQIIKYYFENGKVLRKVSNYYYYYYLFLNSASLRKSCYTCKEAENHCSDVTMWDAWQIKGDDNKGTSAICLNTKKGEKFFSKIEDDFISIIKSDMGSYKSAFTNHDKLDMYKKNRLEREKFFLNYIKRGFGGTLNKWYPMYYKKTRFLTKLRVSGGRIKALLSRKQS